MVVVRAVVRVELGGRGEARLAGRREAEELVFLLVVRGCLLLLRVGVGGGVGGVGDLVLGLGGVGVLRWL